MNLQLIITIIGFIIASTIGYKYYIKVSRATGMGTLSKVALGTRMVISAFSVGMSIYGVYNWTFDFLSNQNGASVLVATSVATVAGILAGLAVEMLLVSAEKALYESWYYGMQMFIGLLIVVVVGQYINYNTMAYNANALVNKIVKKETKIIDSVVLGTSKDILSTNKNTIKSLEDQLKNLKVQDYKKYLGSNYLNTVSNIKRYSVDENKYRSLLTKLRAKKELLESKAKALAQRDLEKRKRDLRGEINKLISTNLSLSKTTLESRDKKIKNAEEIAKNRAETLKNISLYVVLFSVFLSIISSMTSDSLIVAKKNALNQKIRDVKAAREMAVVESELAEAQEAIREIKEREQKIPTEFGDADIKIVDQQTDILNDVPEDSKTIKEIVGFAKEETKEAVLKDFNTELFKIAKELAGGEVHPNRDAIKEEAKRRGLDIKNWSAKYLAYSKHMQDIGAIKERENGRGFIFVNKEAKDEVA